MLRWLTINSGVCLLRISRNCGSGTDLPIFVVESCLTTCSDVTFERGKYGRICNYYYYDLVTVPGMAREFWYRFNYLNSHELPSSTSSAIAKLSIWVFISRTRIIIISSHSCWILHPFSCLRQWADLQISRVVAIRRYFD